MFISSVVIFNSILLGLQTDQEALNPGASFLPFAVAEYICTGVYRTHNIYRLEMIHLVSKIGGRIRHQSRFPISLLSLSKKCVVANDTLKERLGSIFV